MISVTGLLQSVVILLVVGLLYYLLSWAVGKIDPPEPIRKVCDVLLVVLVVVVVIAVLLPLAGGPRVLVP